MPGSTNRVTCKRENKTFMIAEDTGNGVKEGHPHKRERNQETTHHSYKQQFTLYILYNLALSRMHKKEADEMTGVNTGNMLSELG
jgi:hypothetical protein